MPTTAATIDVVQGITEDVQWRFVQSPQQSFQIVPVDNPGKCLANVAGDVELVTVSSSFAETTQFWYLTESQGGYIIENVASHEKLSVSNQNGALTCTLSDESQVWTFMDYHVPTEVSMLSSLANPTLYLKNASGKNYNGQKISVGEDEREDAIEGLPEYLQYCEENNISDEEKSIGVDVYLGKIYGDMCAVRIAYYIQYDAYMIMPISSSIGYQRGVGKISGSSNAVLVNNTVDPDEPNDVVDVNQLLLNFELQSDGSYVIKLRSKPTIALTDNGNTQTVTFTSVSNGATNSQKWTFSNYQYILQDGTKLPYSDVEHYYSSFDWGSPFGSTGWPLTVTSDFGVRYMRSTNPNDFHKGIDLRTEGERELYAPYDGTIERVIDYNASGTGLYIVVRMDCEIYQDPVSEVEYGLFITYMHMSDIEDSLKKGDSVTKGQKVGESGKTGGNYQHHLHYQVSLMPIDDPDTEVNEAAGASINDFVLNPLWFLTPAAYSINP